MILINKIIELQKQVRDFINGRIKQRRYIKKATGRRKKMKFYVDKLPKTCCECHCHQKYTGECYLTCRVSFDTPPRDCPLLLTQSLKQQVGEKVVGEIKNRLAEQRIKMQNDTHCYPQTAVRWEDIVAILDQVEGETKQ